MTKTKVLTVGATGMLGRAVVVEAERRGFLSVGLARSKADINLDIRDLRLLVGLLENVKPDVVINAAAVTSLTDCERDPGYAYEINARPVSGLAKYCDETGTRFVHVSTDHFYRGDGKASHAESAPIKLLNEYARTKFAAEAFATTNPKALILRTCIIGLRRTGTSPTLVEWAIDALQSRKPMRLFRDAYHSPITVKDFAVGMFDLLDADAGGVINLAGRDVVSKASLIEHLGMELGIVPDWVEYGSLGEMDSIRGDSLGLDVTLAESLLKRRLPTLPETARSVISEARA
jgi:dTDP-4-dehydrorhamnose reductase